MNIFRNKMPRRLTALFALVLAFALTACQTAADTPTATPAPTAAPEATPTPAPETTSTPSAVESASPTPETSPEITPDTSDAENDDISVEIETMYPLLTAHMLAILNGGTFDSADPTYFWQTMSFAIDGCGLEFYSAETVGNALMLSRGVVEEIASGLFEDAGDLPEIPEALSGEIQYDADADAYAHPLGGGGYSIAVRSCTEDGDTCRLEADLIADATGQPAASFTAVLVPNTRAGNSLFTYAIRSVTQS